MMQHRAWTAEQRWLVAIVAATSLTLIATVGLPLGPLRALAGAIAILGGPGYALLIAVQPRRMPFVNRLIISFPLSLAVVVLCGLVLNYSPIGIHESSLAAFVCLVTLALLGTAAVRGRGQAALALPGDIGQQVRQALANRWSSVRAVERPTTQTLLHTVIVAVIGLAVIAWAVVGIYSATRPVPTYYTEFSIAAAVPETTTSARLRLSIANHERSRTRYLVRITRLPAALTATLATPGEDERTLELAANAAGTVEATVAFTCGDAIQAQLWLADDPEAGRGEPYRSLRALPDCARP